VTRSNCAFFAVTLYWRRWLAARHVRIEGVRYFIIWRDGPRYLLARKSRLGSLVPHIMYGEDRGSGIRLVHYVPEDPVPRLLPPPLFHGWIKRGDWQDTVAEDQ
jgi:hypothetical protein